LGIGITSSAVNSAGISTIIVCIMVAVPITNKNIKDVTNPAPNIPKSIGLNILNISCPFFVFAGIKYISLFTSSLLLF
jgi:uncharacterized membrane protein